MVLVEECVEALSGFGASSGFVDEGGAIVGGRAGSNAVFASGGVFPVLWCGRD